MIAAMHPLDNPVWHALTGPHAGIAEGGPHAKRYVPDFAPFAALPDRPDSNDWEALAELVAPGGVAAIFRKPLDVPDGWTQLLALPCAQMVATAVEPAAMKGAIELTADDVAEMLALVATTEPGPFAQRTIELGHYLGVRDGASLVAMAGCRMRLDGYREISAVCTLPSHRGRGLGAGLVRDLCERIMAKDDTPMLHVLTTNENAIRLYRALGFETRDEFTVQILRAPE
jgi:predicted GNAT family acetyltransferase